MIGDRYRLGRELGRGGMGAVWQAHDEVLGREVAMKRMIATDQQGLAARAWREARLAASLSNPHVVSVFDLVTEDDDLWLVMEYVDGPSLAGLVAERGPLPPDRAATIIDQVAAALEAAHAAGIVHRDVKPGNVLVPAVGPIKLSDFGIARGLGADATLTMSGAVTGSPVYLAPEVASGAPATPASDVWSLGATLFHMLTGRPPYDQGENVLGVLYRIVHEPAPRTDRAGWLAPLLAGMMSHDPQARWSLARIRAFLAAGPMPAPAGPTAAPPATAPPATAPPATVRPVAAPDPRPPLTAVLPVADAGSPPPPRVAPASSTSAGRTRVGRHPWVALAVALAAVVALAVGAAVALHHRGAGSTRAGRADPPSSHTSGSPSISPSGSSTPSASAPGPASTPSVAGIRDFVHSYLTTAAADPARGFRMLTPGYQAASGGLAGYRSFWGQVTRIHSVRGVRASVSPLGATYTYTYTRRGVGTVTETVHLWLVLSGGHYLIAGGATRRG